MVGVQKVDNEFNGGCNESKRDVSVRRISLHPAVQMNPTILNSMNYVE